MDAATFKSVFLPLHAKLYRMAYRWLENQADAEDMVQECYIRLWQKRHEWPAIENPESFSIAMIKNLCLDFLRKTRPETVPNETLQLSVESIETQIEQRDRLEKVQSIVNQLPAKQKQVVELKYWKDLSDEAIEKQTGLKRGNIKMILSRTRKLIQEQYFKWERK
ncbi:MAG: RNA polymerase sigma factor [Dysgonamonadaceae bacterium]|jgi:RNA polymerase sigma-70 factor (ECF subfamily)|nr:RNA polymerase sigma factor [Dysgonamonadaceae bacterium]